MGQTLKDIEIEKGDRVLIYLNNSPEYIFSLFAIWRIGAIAIPTNRILTAPELNYMITDSDAKLIITDKEAQDTIKGLDIQSHIMVSHIH
jgi:long-chain acyl-CoA synthetase